MRFKPVTQLLAILFLSAACAGQSNFAAPVGSAAPVPAGQNVVALPNVNGSLKFAVIGDMGVGTRQQYEVAQQMESQRQRFDFKTVIMVGDNLYGPERPADYVRKFEMP